MPAMRNNASFAAFILAIAVFAHASSITDQFTPLIASGAHFRHPTLSPEQMEKPTWPTNYF